MLWVAVGQNLRVTTSSELVLGRALAAKNAILNLPYLLAAAYQWPMPGLSEKGPVARRDRRRWKPSVHRESGDSFSSRQQGTLALETWRRQEDPKVFRVVECLLGSRPARGDWRPMVVSRLAFSMWGLWSDQSRFHEDAVQCLSVVLTQIHQW